MKLLPEFVRKAWTGGTPIVAPTSKGGRVDKAGARIINEPYDDNQERYEAAGEPAVALTYAPADLADFLRLYANQPWVYTCASAIAVSAASVQWQVVVDGKEIDAEDRPSWLAQPNPHMAWFDLIENTFLHLELTGNSFWEIERKNQDDPKSEVVAIYPLLPNRVRIVPDPVEKVKEYIYTINGQMIHLPANRVLHLKYPDPLNEHYGCAPIFSAKNDITLDFWITGWNKKFFQEGAVPGGVLKTPLSLSDTAWQRLKAVWNKFHQGWDKAHAIAILEEGLEYQQITAKHTDMQYKDQKMYSREVVMSTMRVPPVMVGLTEGVSYATSQDQKKIFYQDNVIPKLRRLQDAINTFLMLSGTQFQFVTRSIESLVEDDQVKSAIANANVTHGIMTINEVREKYYGLGPVAWGNGYWVPMGLTYVEKGVPLNQPTAPQGGGGNTPAINSGEDAGLADPSQVPKVEPTPPVGPPDQGGFNPGIASGKSYEQQHRLSMGKYDLSKVCPPDPDWEDKLAVHNWNEWNLWKASAIPDERLLRAHLTNYFHGMVARVQAKVEAHWPLRDKKKGEVKKAKDNLDIGDFYNAADEEGRLRALLIPLISSMIQKHGNDMLKRLGVSKTFQMSNPRIVKFLEQFGGTRIRNINATTMSLVQNMLTKAAEAGGDFKSVLSGLVEGFEGEGGLSAMRAALIGRTEIVTLTNTARYEAALQSGVVQKKRWICELLPTSRDGSDPKHAGHVENHVELHNTVVDLEEPFIAKSRSGDEEMDTPGDINASAENVCNCLCIASYYSGTDEFSDLILGDAVDSGDGVEKRVTKKNPSAPQLPPINVTINMPPAGDTIVKNEITIPEQKPPQLTVEARVPQQELPKVEPPTVVVKNELNPTPITVESKVENHVDVKPTPVTVENKVDVQPAPVTVEKGAQAPVVINVQPTPVTVENKIEKDAPAPIVVNVTPEITAKIGPYTEKTVVTRDQQGRVSGSYKDVQPKPE